MSFDQIAPEALKLPPEQRALLASSLWESLEDPYDLAVDLEDHAAAGLAVERDREMETGIVIPISHEELMKRLGR
ncbi:MAG: addiction module protein [Verrucomicrobiales bacterium]|nr:addiction module protein [Verrucomicrobiales bacterium]